MVNKCVIDVGSNTIKLYIANLDNNNLKPIVIKRRMTRLGKDIHKTGVLPEDGKALVIKHIEEYLNICNQYLITKDNILLTATAACRNASDGRIFVEGIQNKYELENAKVLSGKEEAEYNFLGVLESFENNTNNTFCVLDVGGGSFQISIGTKDRFLAGTSIQKGCNIITEKFNLSQRVSKEVAINAIRYIKNLDINDIELLNNEYSVVGVGGTIKIMQLMLKNSEDYTPLQLDDLYNTAYNLALKTTDEIHSWFIEKYPDNEFRIDSGLTKNRAEVILSGVCIVIGLLEKLSAKEVLLSKTDAKDYIIKLKTLTNS